MRHAAPWTALAVATAMVLYTSAIGLGVSRWASDHGLRYVVSWGVPLLMASMLWRGPRLYARLGVAPEVAIPWIVLGLAADVVVLILGQSGIERIHVLTFGLLGGALVAGFVPLYGFVDGGFLVVLLGAAMGLLDEIYQGFLPDRVYDPRDVLMNTFAVIAVLSFARPFGKALAKAPRAVERSVWNAAAVLGSVMVLVLILGSRPKVETGELFGVWDGTNPCGVAETLDFKSGGRLRWKDADGNDADASWSLTSNAWDALLDIMPTRARNRRAGCGFHERQRILASIRLSRDALTILVPEPLRYAKRAPSP